MLPKLGIIAGSGDLPYEIAKLYESEGGSCCIASLIPDASFDGFTSKEFAIGQVGLIVDFLKENYVENIIIIGGIKRPDIRSLKVDLEGSKLIATIMKKKIWGDDSILRIISDYLESKNFKVISPIEILKISNMFNRFLPTAAPSEQDLKDIEIGKLVIKSLGQLDIGQSVIVFDGYVLGIEAAEGTDELIKRCSKLRKKSHGGVLVKMSKPSQDMRLDVPVIGPDTVELLRENMFNGVAIEKSGVIMINPKKTSELLDEYGLFLHIL